MAIFNSYVKLPEGMMLIHQRTYYINMMLFLNYQKLAFLFILAMLHFRKTYIFTYQRWTHPSFDREMGAEFQIIVMNRVEACGETWGPVWDHECRPTYELEGIVPNTADLSFAGIRVYICRMYIIDYNCIIYKYILYIVIIYTISPNDM